MKVRQKLFLAMASIVLFMGIAFFVISRGYLENLFQQYAQATRQGNANQWARLLAYYYQTNDNQWIGVTQYVLHIYGHRDEGGSPVEFLAVYNQQGVIVAQVGHQHALDPHHDHDDQMAVTIEAGGQPVGKLLIVGSNTQGLYGVEQTVLHSMTIATLWGTGVTVLMALLTAAWMSNRITSPLKHMLKAIRQISRGELETEVTIESADEFGQVANAFNEMTHRLSRTEEARRHLVADVAHELRMPLTIMQTQLELIQQGLRPAEPETLLPIQDEVFRLTRLVQDLHQLTLAEVGKLPLHKAPTDIVQLIDRVLGNFEIEAEDKHISMNLRPSSSELIVPLDPDRITQVFVNLIGNAIRYTPEYGHMDMRIYRHGDFCHVSVQDSGPGMPEDTLIHIFDRFYRADEDRSRHKGGAGLGLAIAKEFVQAHGGNIDVTSVVGTGTKFIVKLPTEDGFPAT